MPPSAGVIGWPVAHSKSPLIHRFWLAKLGIDGDYARFPVTPERLASAIRALPALGLRGVNITVPHKVAVLAHLDVVEAGARAVGAVNTVCVGADGRTTGANTDIDGVLEVLAGIDLEGADAVMIGAGGAARAVVAALQRRNIARVTIVNRTPGKAVALLEAMGQAGDVLPLGARLPAAALLVNASSLGMTGAPGLALDLAPLARGVVVFDAVYAPLDTRLLRSARAGGFRTIDGLTMLIGQAANAFERFYRATPPRAHDAELRALLTA